MAVLHSDVPVLQVRLVSQTPTPKLGKPLNTKFEWMREARPASQVCNDLKMSSC